MWEDVGFSYYQQARAMPRSSIIPRLSAYSSRDSNREDWRQGSGLVRHLSCYGLREFARRLYRACSDWCVWFISGPHPTDLRLDGSLHSSALEATARATTS